MGARDFPHAVANLLGNKMEGTFKVDVDTHVKPLLALCQWASQAVSLIESLGHLSEASPEVQRLVVMGKLGYPELVDGDGAALVSEVLAAAQELLSQFAHQSATSAH